MVATTQDHPRWMDPGTHYRLETKDNGKLTGRVICCDCGARHHHIEEIDHGPDCDRLE